MNLSIGRSICWEEKGFSDNRGKTSIGARNQRNLVVYEDVYLKISNKIMSSLFSGEIAGLVGNITRNIFAFSS